MAISATNKLSEAGTPGTSNFTTSGSLNPSVNTLYLLAVQTKANTGTPNTPTATHAGGLSWVQIATVRSGTTQLRWTLFRGMKSSGLSSGTITVSMAAQNTTSIDVIVDEFTNTDTSGTDGSGAIVQNSTGNGNASSSSVTLAAFGDATNNVAYNIVGNDGTQAITPDATATWNELAESTDHLLETAWKIGQDTSISASWSTAKNWGAIAVEIKKKAATAFTQSVSGAITPTGTVVKRAGKKLAGSITPSGVATIHRLLVKTLSGAITPTGALRKLAAKKPAGAVTPSAVLKRSASRHLAGALAPSGALVRRAAKKLVGAVTPVGVLVRSSVFRRVFSGSVTPSGNVVESVSIAPYNFGAFVDDRSKPQPEWDPSGVFPNMAGD